jgi:hypothetical protein
LVGTNNDATNPLGGSFGLVKRNGCTDHTDTITGEEATSDEQRNIGGDGLQNDTNAEDDVASDETKTATKDIGSGSSSQSTKECTGGENGHDQGRLRGIDVEVSVCVPVSGAELVSPVFHAEDTTDGSSIITIMILERYAEARFENSPEEHTTKGDE